MYTILFRSTCPHIVEAWGLSSIPAANIRIHTQSTYTDLALCHPVAFFHMVFIKIHYELEKPQTDALCTDTLQNLS